MSRLVRLLAKGGPLGRELGVRVDLVRSVGARHALERRRDDRRRDPGQRSRYYRRLWADAAAAADAELVELSAPDLLEIRGHRSSVRVSQQAVGIDHRLSIELSLDKTAVHGLLAAAGLPVPPHAELGGRDPADALAFLAAAGGPCVVKPARGTGASEGVTSGIRDRAQLERAWLRASRIGSRILIEREHPGHVYRLLMLDGELIDAVRREPPRVVGDGRSTIEELVFRENRRRADGDGEAGLSPLSIDLDAVLALERAGVGLRSVPPAGTVVAVKGVSQQNRNEDNSTVTDEASQEVVEAAALAARIVGLRLSGVDIIADRLDRPLAATGGVVLEVNAEPGLHHHYQVADAARATPVADRILARLLERSTPRAVSQRQRRSH